MKRMLKILLLAFCLPAGGEVFCQDVDSVALVLSREGFFNVRSAETDSMVVFTIENDRYKIQSEGVARAVSIIEGAGLAAEKPVRLIVTEYKTPQISVNFDPGIGDWKATTRLDEGWDLVRKQKKLNDSFGKVSIVVYPQVALKNLIINQVYQSLWVLSPALEVSLWPGMKFSYQLQFPIFNDGYGRYESKIHPSMITLSQRFRDPWNLNITGRLSVGTFSGARFGAALQLKYYFPNERFSLDGQAAYLGVYYFDSFNLHFDAKNMAFRWNVAANYYDPNYQTQFTLRMQKFLQGDLGIKFEMIRHFKHCSIGVYAMKGLDGGKTNGGFRFQIALPPYRMKRHGYWPTVTTSANMGMVYNANNEQFYYKEFKSEASDNIMTINALNPLYVTRQIGRY